MDEQLATAVYLLADNMLQTFKFSIDKDDARQEAICHAFATFPKFQKDKGKAFNYFTTCIMNHWRQVYRTQKNYTELKNKLLKRLAEQTEGVRLERIDGRWRLSFHRTKDD